MRIAYLLQESGGTESGVFKKVVAQVREWRELGAEPHLFVNSRQDSHASWASALDGLPMSQRTSSGVATSILAISKLIDQITAWKPHLIYFRYGFFIPPYNRLSRIAPLVLEVNSDDLLERYLASRWRGVYNSFTRGRILRSAAGFIFVAGDIATKPHFRQFDKPSIVIPNGIKLSNYPVLPPPNNGQPRLAFMGSRAQPWQGRDKLHRFATAFPDWKFDLIGGGAAAQNGIPPNLRIHGLLSRADYEHILREADMGIGPLALHRTGLNEASPLKVAEYLAHGLPVITPYRDTRRRDQAKWLLELPNQEDNIMPFLNEIRAFVSTWKGRRVPRAELAHIDVGVIEAKRLSFFGRLLGAA